jgi:signal transduction histidine kinase
VTGDSFYVADDGSGFPAGDRESLFEMGYTTDETGTGLGMAAVLRIAQAHGRSVSVAGSEEGGARIDLSGVERPE